jgi:hypothetical protein
MANFLSEANVKKMAALLSGGYSLRAVARALDLNRGTVAQYAKKLQPSSCICGQPARHKGWCGPRHLKTTVNDALLTRLNSDFMEPVLPPAPVRRPRRASTTHRRKQERTYPSLRRGYPYGIRQAETGAHLVELVNSAVPDRIPDEARADICQALLLSILEGDLKVENLSSAVRPAINKRYVMFSTLKTLSLDARIGHDEGGNAITLLDTIPSDYEPILAKRSVRRLKPQRRAQ